MLNFSFWVYQALTAMYQFSIKRLLSDSGLIYTDTVAIEAS